MPLDAKDMVPSLWDVLSKPSPTNTWPLGSTSLAWSNLYLGPNGANAFDPTTGNIGFFGRTAAEVAASITPTVYAYNPRFTLDVNRYGGGASKSAAVNATAISNAMTVLSSSGSAGGVLVFPDLGTYQTNATVSFGDSVSWEGTGMQATTVQYTGSGTFLTFPSSSARNALKNLHILGTGKTGTGIQIGDTNFSGRHLLDNVEVSAFATGVRFAGALYTTLFRSLITGNTVGVDFNAGWGAGFSTTIAIMLCDIIANDHEGIAASNVPIRNQSVTILGGAIEGNCLTDATRYQYVTGSVEQLGLYNVYFETANASNGLNPDSAGPFTIQDCFFHNHTYGIKSASASQGRIDGCRFLGTVTNDIFLGAGTSSIEIGTSNSFDAAGNSIAGTGNIVYTTVKAQQFITNQAWTPTLVSSGGGTPTYSTQSGWYSKVGNLVQFSCRVSITALGTLGAGNLSLAGLPVAVASNTIGTHTFALEADGVTVSGGNTYFFAEAVNGTTSILLMQGGAATAAVQLTQGQIAAATTFILSGTYQATS